MKKRLIILSIVFIILISMVNCKKLSESNNETTSNDSKTVLEIWVMPNSGKDTENDMNKIASPFLKDNPDVKLNIKVLEWNIAFNKILDAVTGAGERPDIIQLGTTWVGMMASQKPGLSDMSQVYNLNNFVEGSLSTTKLLGEEKIVAIPWFIDTRLLYYRKDLCEKAGVNPEKDFATWESFKNSLKKLKDVEINNIKIAAMGMPGKNDWNVPHNFSWWIWGAGGDFLNEEAKKSILDEPESLEGIKFYTQLAHEGLLSKEALKKNMVDVSDMFINGRFATIISGVDLINNIKDFKPSTDNSYDISDFGVTMIPKGPKKRVAFFGGSVLSILESSENKNLSAKFVRYLTSEKVQIELIKSSGILPALKSVYDLDVIKKDPMKVMLKEQIKYGKSYPSISEWGTIESLLMTEMGEIWDIVIDNYSEEKIEEKVQLISKNVDEILAKN